MQIIAIGNFVFLVILKDPFGDVIKGIMNEIHTHAQLNPLCQPGTQNYEQWVVQKEQNGKRDLLFFWNLLFQATRTCFLQN